MGHKGACPPIPLKASLTLDSPYPLPPRVCRFCLAAPLIFRLCLPHLLRLYSGSIHPSPAFPPIPRPSSSLHFLPTFKANTSRDNFSVPSE
ncbi:hypothetical protein HPP92_012504 [Vanilla planifolia]|uniref:Uncharacterized protein n=1 Tax=Vanilla planifolia TaxID=51239 RepID=A0A835V3E3_VANPL|nr:hypothetical protein HPP92_012504 [Vanilla planifolia]